MNRWSLHVIQRANILRFVFVKIETRNQPMSIAYCTHKTRFPMANNAKYLSIAFHAFFLMCWISYRFSTCISYGRVFWQISWYEFLQSILSLQSIQLRIITRSDHTISKVTVLRDALTYVAINITTKHIEQATNATLNETIGLMHDSLILSLILVSQHMMCDFIPLPIQLLSEFATRITTCIYFQCF